MYYITYNKLSGFYVVKSHDKAYHNVIFFASRSQHSAAAALMTLELDNDRSYQDWLAEQDAMLAEA